jgi:hypothetical protein
VDDVAVELGFVHVRNGGLGVGLVVVENVGGAAIESIWKSGASGQVPLVQVEVSRVETY